MRLGALCALAYRFVLSLLLRFGSSTVTLASSRRDDELRTDRVAERDAQRRAARRQPRERPNERRAHQHARTNRLAETARSILHTHAVRMRMRFSLSLVLSYAGAQDMSSEDRFHPSSAPVVKNNVNAGVGQYAATLVHAEANVAHSTTHRSSLLSIDCID
jgi:hypothetical protein